jgi:hypothetical protein
MSTSTVPTLFVQSILDRSTWPSSAGWDFLKASIKGVASADPTTAIDTAIMQFTGNTLGEEVARFWGDNTNIHPKFGPTALLNFHSLFKSETIQVKPAKYLGAKLEDLWAEPSVHQLDVVIPKLSAGVEAWVNYGSGVLTRLQEGESFNETFCRTGYTPGTFPLPKTGDVRVAITSTGKTPPPIVKIKALTSGANCPKQITIVPGFEIGALHLGMTAAQAGKAAKLWRCVWHATLPTGDAVRYCIYNEGPWFRGVPEAPVEVYFLNGRVGLLGVADDQQFITTTGIRTYDRASNMVPGSTKQDFESSARGVECSTIPYDLGAGQKNKGCYYSEPANRFTFVVAPYEQCLPRRSGIDCYWPAPDYYVGFIGVATQKAFNLASDCVLSGKNCAPGLLRPAGNVLGASHLSHNRDTVTATRLGSLRLGPPSAPQIANQSPEMVLHRFPS